MGWRHLDLQFVWQESRFEQGEGTVGGGVTATAAERAAAR
jgi:hypothetical protein